MRLYQETNWMNDGKNRYAGQTQSEQALHSIRKCTKPEHLHIPMPHSNAKSLVEPDPLDMDSLAQAKAELEREYQSLFELFALPISSGHDGLDLDEMPGKE